MQVNTKLTKYKQNTSEHPTNQRQIECKPTSNLPHRNKKQAYIQLPNTNGLKANTKHTKYNRMKSNTKLTKYKYNECQHPTYQNEIEYKPILDVINTNRLQDNPKLPNTNRKQANIQLTKYKQNASEHPTYQIQIECKPTSIFQLQSDPLPLENLQLCY